MSSRVRAACICLLFLGGCPKPHVEPPAPLLQTPTVMVVPSGQVVDGAYVDGTWPLTVNIPAGWSAETGRDGEPERVTLTSPDGQVHVVIAGTPGNTLSPRPLPGCTWTFADEGRYRAFKIRDLRMAATCTPIEPTGPRVLAYIAVYEGVVWHVEGRIPQGNLRAGKAGLDKVVGGVRFR